MDIFGNLQKLIGNTPLVEIAYRRGEIVKRVRAKLEWYNLSGSIKDRPAFEILKSAYGRGALSKGQIICETTSGNMGISLAVLANYLGNPVVICMPKSMSRERQELLKLCGAKLELTESFDEAFALAEEYGKMGAFLAHQFENDDNLLSHYKTTAREIYDKIRDIPCFVGGVGTGGTLMGTGLYLKEKCGAKIIAVDPEESGLLTYGGARGKHKIQGLSDGIIPKLYKSEAVDRIICVKSDDAIAMAQKLSRELGLSVGISSGANFLACVESDFDGAVTVFADDSKKYLSTDLVNNILSEKVDEIELLSYSVIN